MKSVGLLAFLPVEAVPFLIVGAGSCMILGARKLAGALFLLCGAMLFLPVILDPFLASLPEWALPLILVVVMISLFGTLITMLLGKGAKDHMVGTLAADMIKVFLRMPFRILGALVRGIFRRGR